MIITTIGEYGINTIFLPQKVSGQYWLYESVSATGREKLVAIEGINNEWIIKSNRKVKVLDGGNAVNSAVIKPQVNCYYLKKSDGENICIFIEPVTLNRQVFTKFLVRDGTELTIGRSDNCDISYSSSMVSSSHAVLSLKDGVWYIQDTDSKNGTFANDEKVQRKQLNIGDIIFIVGLKIIVGKNVIAINNPDGEIYVSDKLQNFVNQEIEETDTSYEYELPEKEFFYRSPRFKRDIETAKIKVDSPPPSPISEEMPWMLVMGSSMAMGVMSLVTLVSAIISFNITSIVMGASMLIGTVLLPNITKRYEKKRKEKKEALRQKKYREYLQKIAAQISEISDVQEQILNENHVTIQECEARIKETKRNLWERGFGQNDFLKVRVGIGTGILDAEISYSERKFSLDDDNLQEELYTLCEREKPLHNIPITYSLYENHISGVIGARENVIAFAKGLIIQLAALYSYDEVKFVFIYDKEEQSEFGFVKWLPHTWSDENKFRYIATDINEAKELSSYFESIIENREKTNESDKEDIKPYFIVFSASKYLAARTEMMKKVLTNKSNLHISIVNFCDELKNLPKECSMVAELNGITGKLYDKNDITGKTVEFTPDIQLNEDPRELSVALANTRLDTTASGFKLPEMITFMELFGVGSVEHLNVLTRWKENDPTKSLEAAVGVDTYGELFKLDLHEKFHGPHGLVAGMTGSGKSEFIITYILSLAVNYHPDEVAFILIDYKGGGMAKSLEKLPHTAGVITNLDGASIKRSLLSIESELKRRQSIFAQASKETGVSNIDIYKYQKLYREGAVAEPLQHLFIISDEFAELKTQQAEFMTQLVSAARIGRSLGVHLILATQKPSGVVDDQIWSNSKFRVCLKVQERADSMDMIKRPDAAELTETGRFYLQVGYNELFELGQSAWAGATYYPSDKVIKDKDDSVAVIDTNGHIIKQAKIDKRKTASGKENKQLDAITSYLRRIAEEEGIKVRPLWLEPISPDIILDEVREKYAATSRRYVLNPVIGEFDDPANQRQCVLRLPISEEGNTVVYGVAGSGKTSFLNAVIYSLIKEHTPEEVNMYILDFASETLKSFSKAPHVGDVVLSYESEKISNLFKMLMEEVGYRKKLFSDYGGDYASFIGSSGKTLPSIVVMINNFAAFTEIYEEQEEIVSYLSREGTKYGVYFILTALGTGAVRFRLLQNFKQLFVMQLNDESDYSTVVGKTEGLYPSKYKGRGLVRKENVYEFQIANIIADNPYRYIQQYCIRAGENWSGNGARKIPILPDKVNDEFLKDYIKSGNSLNVPIGVENSTLNVHYYPFDEFYINMITSVADECNLFAADMISLLKHTNLNGIVLDPTEAIVSDNDRFAIYSSESDIEKQVDKLYSVTVERHNAYKEAASSGNTPEQSEQLVIVLNSLAQIKSLLSKDGNEKLSLVLERGALKYNMLVIISDQVKNIPTYSFEKWYKTNVSVNSGIWVGNGISEQYQMKANKVTSEMREEITSEFGYALNKGKCVKVKLLTNTIKEENEYE